MAKAKNKLSETLVSVVTYFAAVGGGKLEIGLQNQNTQAQAGQTGTGGPIWASKGRRQKKPKEILSPAARRSLCIIMQMLAAT